MKAISVRKTCLAFGLLLAGVGFGKADSYKPLNTSLSGNLSSVGSDTLNNMMSLWAEGFMKIYPSVQVQVEGKGSSTAPPALISGTAQFGPMSRAMKQKEIDAFEKKYNYKPSKIAVAVDTLAVYVHKDNPITGLTLQQVDAIFSKYRKGRYPNDVKTWGDLGLTGEWANKPISLYGRNSASGTYGYFKKKALFKGDFKDAVKEQPGSASVVEGIGKDLYGIGYSGIGYKTSDVRAVPLSKRAGKDFATADFANTINRTYPLGRFLYVYFVKDPSKPLPLNVREFLRYTLSEEGQKGVVKDGYGALPPVALARQLRIIGVESSH